MAEYVDSPQSPFLRTEFDPFDRDLLDLLEEGTRTPRSAMSSG
jgi:hypothetical protein